MQMALGMCSRMEYHLNLPLMKNEISKLQIRDVIYVSGKIFTARDEAHQLMLDLEANTVPFTPAEMALFHCGPLMKQVESGWQVISAGPTTSSRMELFEDRFIAKYSITLIIGKGGMSFRTQHALQKHGAVYTAFTGGVGALAADLIDDVLNVFWLERLGMPEAVWLFRVKDFGPLIVAMDAHGASLYKR
jgi:tartrate/fumarate subfamily iron-sulfur-dependent hydro-lyase beta chain